eukprot:tig00020912_g15851.t1
MSSSSYIPEASYAESQGNPVGLPTALPNAEDADGEGDEFVIYTDEEWEKRRKHLDAWYWDYARIGRKNGKEFIKCMVDGCNNQLFSFAAKAASSFTRHLAKHELTDPVANEKAAAIAAQSAQRNKRRDGDTPKQDRQKPAKKSRQSAPSAIPNTLASAASAIGSNSAEHPWGSTPQPGAIAILGATGLMRAGPNDAMAPRVHIRVQCEGLLETANVSFHPKLDTFPDVVRRAATALARATDGPLASILMDGSNMRSVLRDRGGYIVGDLCDLVPDELYRLVLL